MRGEKDGKHCIGEKAVNEQTGKYCAGEKRQVSGRKMENKKKKENITYILRCADGSLYTGWTNDLDHRVRMHNEGKGAKYTKGRGPVELVHHETFGTKEEAMRREYEIKQMSRSEKEQLIGETK